VIRTSDDETNPSLALAHKGGQFVVAFDTSALSSLGGDGFQVLEMSRGDLPAPLAAISAGEAGSEPIISIDGFGRYLVTYTKRDGSGNLDIFSRRELLS
jgi:hypothetical protein